MLEKDKYHPRKRRLQHWHTGVIAVESQMMVCQPVGSVNTCREDISGRERVVGYPLGG